MKFSLTKIGYWHSEQEPDWPDPGHFVDENWDPKIKKIVTRYLKFGFCFTRYFGMAFCRFRCEKRSCGNGDYTDGFYIWPEGLYHYVECHSVRLPEKFIQHVLRVNRNILFCLFVLFWRYVSVCFLLLGFIDDSWWLSQKKQNEEIITFTSPFISFYVVKKALVEHLFDLDLGYEKKLAENNICKEIQDKFENENYPISECPTIEIVIKGKCWLTNNEDQEHIYTIIKNNKSLEVYCLDLGILYKYGYRANESTEIMLEEERIREERGLQFYLF